MKGYTCLQPCRHVPHIVYKVLGTLGQKLFFRLPFKEITTKNVNEELGSDFNTKFDSIQTALFDYLKWFEIGPDLMHDNRDGEGNEDSLFDYEKDLRFNSSVPGNQFKFHDDNDIVWKEVMKEKKLDLKSGKNRGARLLKMKWDRNKDDSHAKQCIAKLAVLLSHLSFSCGKIENTIL
jgi:hypothetical protein